MGLFYISAWDKSAHRDTPIWEYSLSAKDIDEAYRVGKAQFQTERPELDLRQFRFEATWGSVEK